MESTPSACRICCLCKGFWAALLQWPSMWPEGHTWKLRLTKVKNYEMVFDRGILLPAHLTLVKKVLAGYPRKTESFLLLKALARTT